MVSGLNFNMGYNGCYTMLPLPKTKIVDGKEFSVKASNMEEIEKTPLKMDNLDDLRMADADKNDIISIQELRNYKNKNAFMLGVLSAMERFENQRLI